MSTPRTYVRWHSSALRYTVTERAGTTYTYLGVIRTVESLGEVGRLRKGHAAEAADEAASDDTLLVAENANLKTRVLRSLEHLVPVKAVKRLCRVLTRNVAVDEDRPPAGM